MTHRRSVLYQYPYLSNQPIGHFDMLLSVILFLFTYLFIGIFGSQKTETAITVNSKMQLCGYDDSLGGNAGKIM